MRNKSGSGAAHVGMFGRTIIHMNKEGDGEGGGGDGGGDDDETKFTERFNKLFHKAMGEREKRLEQRLAKTFEGLVGSKIDELREAIFAVDETEGQGQQGAGEGGQRKGDEISPELRAQIKRAEDSAKEAAAKADKWEREAKAANEAKKKTEERNLLVSSLNGRVKPALLDMVVDQLHGKHLVRDEEDPNKILWKNAEGELLPFKDGVESWAKSDFGKEVAPPVAARGSGGRGSDGTMAGGKEMNAEILGGIITSSLPR